MEISFVTLWKSFYFERENVFPGLLLDYFIFRVGIKYFLSYAMLVHVKPTKPNECFVGFNEKVNKTHGRSSRNGYKYIEQQ